MSPFTHLLVGWEIGCRAGLSVRDRNLVVFAGIAPDIDGLGLLVDAGAHALGHPSPGLYAMLHHRLFHGLLGALLVFGLAYLLGEKKWLAAVLAAVAFHLHLVCDVLGSGGPRPEDIWPICYLAPFSEHLTIRWPGQWLLNGWQNLVFTAVLLAFACRRAVRDGVSPFILIGKNADAAAVSLARRCRDALRRKV